MQAKASIWLVLIDLEFATHDKLFKQRIPDLIWGNKNCISSCISVQLIIHGHGKHLRSKSDRLTGTFAVLVDIKNIRIVKLRVNVQVGWKSGEGKIYTLVLKHCHGKKNGPLIRQVFLDSSDQCGRGTGWQNLRKWEKTKFGQKHLKKGLKRLDLVWYGLVMTQLWS